MTEVTEPRLAEAIPVTLERIQGMVGGVAKDIANVLEKVVDLRTEVTEHRGQIGSLQSEMQQVRSDQATAAKDLKAADKAREDTAIALEKQTADQVAKAKAAVEQSVQKWTPPMRLSVIFGSIFTGAGVIFGIVWAIKTGVTP